MQKQTSLFESVTDKIDIVDGQLSYYNNWLDDEAADELFVQLKQQVGWQQSIIQLYGKPVKIPRLNAWYGDAHCLYQYSGHSFVAEPWLPCLLDIKHRLEQLTGYDFNSVLVNCYRNERDSVAWHSDDEPELGRNPVIASISLGAERRFQLRHRYNKGLPVKNMQLTDGSLLVMAGELQHYWHHQLPKSNKPCGERINLTYRQVNFCAN